MQAATKLVRPLRSGQITIPVEFRRELQIDEHTMLQMALVDGELRIRPVKVARAAQSGSDWAQELYDLFASVRQETAKYPSEEVDADIAKAVSAVRRKRAARGH